MSGLESLVWCTYPARKRMACWVAWPAVPKVNKTYGVPGRLARCSKGELRAAYSLQRLGLGSSLLWPRPRLALATVGLAIWPTSAPYRKGRERTYLLLVGHDRPRDIANERTTSHRPGADAYAASPRPPGSQPKLAYSDHTPTFALCFHAIFLSNDAADIVCLEGKN